MKGYLLQDKTFIPGEDLFVESVSSETDYAVVFEDDTETAYFYALQVNPQTGEQQILDGLHIYDMDNPLDITPPAQMKIIWSTDWLKCALIINDRCHALYDFENQGGYNRSEFPPPNDIWTKKGRTLTDDRIMDTFG